MNRSLARMQERRFVARCDAQIYSIERADTLRELSRLSTSISLPYMIPDDIYAREALRNVLRAAEDRARDLIYEEIKRFLRAEDILREKIKRRMVDSWTELNGPLAHIRSWAQNKLTLAEQQLH